MKLKKVGWILMLITIILIPIGIYSYKNRAPIGINDSSSVGLSENINTTIADNSTNSSSALDFVISPIKSSYNKSEPIEINSELRNKSRENMRVFLGSCAENYKVYINDKLSYSKPSSGCKISSTTIETNKSLKQKFKFDASDFTPGEYWLKIETENTTSNTIKINIVESLGQIDCYNYTSNINLSCDQIVFHTNIIGLKADNAGRCKRIFNRFIKNSKLSPIDQLSTLSCNGDTPAYFIVNVPKSDTNKWTSLIENAGEDAEIFLKWNTERLPKLVY